MQAIDKVILLVCLFDIGDISKTSYLALEEFIGKPPILRSPPLSLEIPEKRFPLPDTTYSVLKLPKSWATQVSLGILILCALPEI